MPAQTASESAICGTWRGETNEANWIVVMPVSDNASTRRILSAVEILSGWPMPSNWKPSRGPASTSVTFLGSDARRGRSARGLPVRGHRPARQDLDGGQDPPRRRVVRHRHDDDPVRLVRLAPPGAADGGFRGG